MDTGVLAAIQGEMARCGLDGWLMYDFHGTNPIAVRFLELKGVITRRSFFFIPAAGKPTALIHNIEKKSFEHLPGKKIYFSAYVALEQELRTLLEGKKRIAMEYSPMGRLPYIGKVDAGTIELIRSLGVEVVTSADLVAKFDAALSADQIAMHREAAVQLNRIKDDAFALIQKSLREGKTICEYDVTRFVMDEFARAKMVTDFPPICGVGPNAGNPHYEPPAVGSSVIKKNDLVLLDLWAKLDKPKAAMADITWMAFAGPNLPKEWAGNFSLICMARDAAVEFVRAQWGKKPICGYEIDNVCRSVIAHADQGDYFTHRTGHSIAEETHGPGPNIDNLETEDRRTLQPGHLFSIEPGLYYPEYGLRTEIDVLITPNGPEVTTQPVQQEFVILDV
jgi:Xaa-Pro dipeptidase